MKIRRNELIRLAKKQGFYDGNTGKPKTLPTRIKMVGKIFVECICPPDEVDAYLTGHAEGEMHPPHTQNTHGLYERKRK